eukprot:CAMPEP_0184435432 /NCGR_PEP_ID=MMETSP0738-20130409/491456_1 /TAXON_ID=385413 /ORGANISM="Thalassiosira miniscula, Strain CCMP1093" /LENGTH=84 /DNA_ID=CAMNT_0026801829 /DNA_START=30 /DNA_END=284 /DNA_ORIENTATION=-
MKPSGDRPKPSRKVVSSRPSPAEDSVKFKNEAPMMISMIIDVTLIVPSRLSRIIVQFTPPKASAISNAPATPTAAASVGVAHPR